MKPFVWGLVPLAVLGLLVAMFLNRLETPRMAGAIDSPLLGKPVPALNGLTTKPPYIINVFASWCAPCAVEHPFLMDLKKQGISIVGIAYKDTPENIARYLKAGGNPYAEIIRDPQGMAGITLGITGVPESFAVNAQGIVTARQQGPFMDGADANAFSKKAAP